MEGIFPTSVPTGQLSRPANNESEGRSRQELVTSPRFSGTVVCSKWTERLYDDTKRVPVGRRGLYSAWCGGYLFLAGLRFCLSVTGFGPYLSECSQARKTGRIFWAELCFALLCFAADASLHK